MQEKDKRSTKQCKYGFYREETVLDPGISHPKKTLHHIQCSYEFEYLELNSIFWLFQSQDYQVKSSTGSLQLGLKKTAALGVIFRSKPSSSL